MLLIYYFHHFIHSDFFEIIYNLLNSSRGYCIWDLWSSDDSDDEDQQFVAERRQYNLYERMDHFNKWDDIDFFRRFRLRKETVANILDLIRPKLENKSQR